MRQLLERLRALKRQDPGVSPIAKEELEWLIGVLMRFLESESRETKILVVRKIDWFTEDQPVPQQNSNRTADGTEIPNGVGDATPQRHIPPTLHPPIRKPAEVLKTAPLETLMAETKSAMTNVISALSAELMRDYWKRGDDGLRKDSEPLKSAEVKQKDRKYLLAEDIVALPFYTHIRRAVIQMRSLLFFVVFAFCLLFVALHTYAFRADDAIDRSLLVLFLILGTGTAWVLAQMERDALLSRLENNHPGELNKGFYFNMIKFGIVPFLTILGSQVPTVSNLLLRWAQPALEAFR